MSGLDDFDRSSGFLYQSNTWHEETPNVAALVARPDWHAEAACRDMDPALFFPTRGDNAGVDAARAVCRGCPVREQCLDAGFKEKVGIWGGTSEKERRRLRGWTPGGKKREDAA